MAILLVGSSMTCRRTGGPLPVMSRGAIVQQGKGGDMESDGVRAMVTI